jgi:hypothetical protein
MNQRESFGPHGKFTLECLDADGNIKWSSEFDNIVTDAGINYLLDAGLSGGTPITAWYVGLKGTGSVAAGDTLASHAGWSELTPYSGNRLAWTDGGVSAKSVTNSASPASFAITGTATVTGAFLASAATGTSGTLFSVGDSASSKSVEADDTLNVTYTISGADDGA